MATKLYYSKKKLAAARLVLKCFRLHHTNFSLHQRSVPVRKYSENSE